MRFSNFKASLARVSLLNKQHSRKGSPVFGVTRFSDLSRAEFRSRYLNYRPTDELHQAFHAHRTVGLTQLPARRFGALPVDVDWRT